MSTETLTVSPIESLVKYSNTAKPVDLPGWEPDVPFIAELRRSSLRGAIMSAKGPYLLLVAAHRLYAGLAQPNPLVDETPQVFIHVLRDDMVKPTLKEFG